MQFNNKIIGISGGSGAGKTTLANALLKHYAGEVLLISYDRYYRRMECGNYDIPEALDTELLLEHLHLLKAGQSAALPIYDRILNQRTTAVDLALPKPILIVEGIFALYHPELVKLYSCKVFVETPTDIRYQRRLLRDIQERGDTEASVTKAWTANALPMHHQLIEPQRNLADFIISGQTNTAEMVKALAEQLSRDDISSTSIG